MRRTVSGLDIGALFGGGGLVSTSRLRQVSFDDALVARAASFLHGRVQQPRAAQTVGQSGRVLFHLRSADRADGVGNAIDVGLSRFWARCGLRSNQKFNLLILRVECLNLYCIVLERIAFWKPRNEPVWKEYTRPLTLDISSCFICSKTELPTIFCLEEKTRRSPGVTFRMLEMNASFDRVASAPRIFSSAASLSALPPFSTCSEPVFGQSKTAIA